MLYRAAGADGNLFEAGLRLSPDVQRKERLLNCAGWIHEDLAVDDPWPAAKRLLRGRANLREDAGVLLRNAGLLTRAFHSYFVARRGLPRKRSALSLDCMCEQVPNPESRVTLSDSRDDLGQPIPRIDWRKDSQEPRAMRRFAELAIEEFPRLGLPAPVLEPWVRDGLMCPDHFEDNGHPTGTTRMSDDPTRGVVDRSLQAHGVSGLYVAGSSVFPTTGHCNPTHLIVALAIRLADHLRHSGIDDSQRVRSNPSFREEV
jgi:choline dehydrogenase-like flavoprotein